MLKKIPVLDFIKLLSQHLLEKNFKMPRYYGLYTRHHETIIHFLMLYQIKAQDPF